MATKKTRAEQAAETKESERVAALPAPVLGEPYEETRHPSSRLMDADLGVSYEDPANPIIVPLPRSVPRMPTTANVPDPSRAFRKNLLRANRVAKLAPPRTPAERLALARRKRRKEAEAQGRVQTPEGISRQMRARLQDAERHAATDPKARALLDKAKLAKRIEVAKREAGVSDKPAPTRFMGATSAVELERSAMAAPLPPRMSQVREGTAQPKKRRG